MAQLIKSELWTKYVAEVASGRHVSTLGEVNRWLHENKLSDLSDLRDLLFTDSGPQRNAAVQTLLTRHAHGDIKNQSELAQSLCPGLHRIVAECYPLTKAGQQAMTLWQWIELEGAANFLNQWVDGHGIAEATAQTVTMNLSFGNQESFVRLRRFAENNPNVRLAGNAVLVLERTAPDWPERLKEYGRQWREKRDCRTLLHLTNQLVDRRPREDAYIAPILEAMGEPDSAAGGEYTYFTKEEFHGWLFLVTDKSGKITGWKLENC